MQSHHYLRALDPDHLEDNPILVFLSYLTLSALLKSLLTLLLTLVIYQASKLFYNAYLHPLRKFPGPWQAGVTDWWKTGVEVGGRNWVDVLEELHREFGDVVRVAPNELHFNTPAAYHEIYNSANRWNKEKILYESFGEDHSSFGFQTYAEAKVRKDVLQPMFSRRAILNLQGLVRKNMDHLAERLAENNSEGKSSDLLFAFRCFAMDTVTTFCFDNNTNALDAPDFQAPITKAIDASLPTFHVFKHFPPIRKLIFSLPPKVAIAASPDTAGLTQLQVILDKQVKAVWHNPKLLKDAEYPTIYSKLLDPASFPPPHYIPTPTALYEEAQTMLFAGGVTVGDTLMTGHYYILSNPDLYAKLKAEIRTAWPKLHSPPSLEVLEKLPLLTATIKESLRMSPGACSPLLRVVPPSGANIGGQPIPGGAIVGMSAVLVHRSKEIFPEPQLFKPERWMAQDTSELDKNLVSFSRGPRSCLGINLAWSELYTVFASMLRRFEVELEEGTTGEEVVWRDCFTPWYKKHLRGFCTPVRK